MKILTLCMQESSSSSQIAEKLGYKSTPGSLRKSLPKLVQLELLAYTIPDKPRNRLQKYRITPKGRSTLEQPGRDTGK